MLLILLLFFFRYLVHQWLLKFNFIKVKTRGETAKRLYSLLIYKWYIIKIQNYQTSVKKDKISKLKKKINLIVKDGHYDFDDVFKDYNYCNSNSTVFECVVYFLIEWTQ